MTLSENSLCKYGERKSERETTIRNNDDSNCLTTIQNEKRPQTKMTVSNKTSKWKNKVQKLKN